MPTFSYQAIDADGQEVAGTLEAGGLGAAIDKVRALGLFPDSVKDDSAEAGAPRRFFGVLAGLRFGRKSRQARIALFTRELADLLAGGVPLPLSLSLLHDRQRSGGLKRILSNLAADIDGGVRLSETMAKYPKSFGEFYVSMIQTGEDNGNLETAVQDLAQFLEEDNALIKKTTRRTGRSLLKLFAGYWALIYLTRVIRYFTGGIFSEIPLFEPNSISGRLLGTIDLLMTWTEQTWFFILWCGIFSLLGMKALDLFGPSRRVRDHLLMRSPYSRRRVKNVSVIQFTKAIGTLMACGAPVDRSLTPAIKAIDNRAIPRKFTRISGMIKGGATVAHAFEKSGLLAPLALSMIAAGERTDSLDSALLKVADIYGPKVAIPSRHFVEALFFASLFVAAISLMTVFVLLSLHGALAYLFG